MSCSRRSAASFRAPDVRSSARARARLAAVLLAAMAGLTATAGTGTWTFDSTGTANWSDTTKWSGGTIADGAGFTANLTANISAARTVTLDSARTIGTVNIGDSATSFFSYTLALGANNLTFDNSASAAVLAQSSTSNGDTITGASGGKLVIAGNGTLNVTNAASGKTLTISSGIISGLSTGTQTLNFNNANAVTVGGVIGDGATGGKIAVTQTGSSTTTLSTNNTFTGSITQSAGTLTLSGTNTASGVNLSAGTLNINNAGALGAGTLTISGGTINNSSAGAITNTGNNVQAWNGNFAYTGTQALNLGTGAITLGAASNVTVTTSTNGSNALTVGGDISGAGKGLTKAGTGTLILSGTNSYDGGTTINGGVLQFNSAAAIAGSGQNVAVNSSGAAAFGYAFDQSTLTGRLVSGSTGTVALAADNSNNLDFAAAGLTKLGLGASSGSYTYSGSLWAPSGNIYRLGGGGGTLVFNPTLTGASNSLLVGGNLSGGTVTLVNAGTYGGGTTVTGARGSFTAAIGSASGMGLLQTNVLSGASTTPFGTNTAITLNNGALGLGTAGTLGVGEAVNASGYNLTYNGQNAISLKAGSGSATMAVNTLTRVNNGVLVLNPTSGVTLGSTEKVTVASGAPTVTNGMVAPYYINGTTKNFLTYDGLNGFKDVTYSITGNIASAANMTTAFGSAGATDIISLTGGALNNPMGGNKAIYALKLSNSTGFNANAIGANGETLTLLSGGLILDMATTGSGYNFASGTVYGTVNFGSAEAMIGVFGSGGTASLGNSSPFIGTGGLTLYGNGNASGTNILITGGITIAGAKFTVGNNGALNSNNQLMIDKAGTLQFGNVSQQFLGLSGEGLVNSSTGSGTLIIDGLTGTGTTTFTGLIQNGSGIVGLTKSGANTQVLTGSNTYTGSTTVNGGTLRLDFSAADAPASHIINNTASSSALVLGGGKLDIVGAAGATNSQQFNGLTVNAGNSAISASSGASGTANVTLGSTLTRNTGGTLNVVTPASGAVSTAATTTLTNGVLSMSASNPTAFATVNGTDWATVSGGVIGAISSYATGNANYTSANNVDVTDGDSVSAVTVNSLRFNSATAGLTLSGTNTVNTGGILVTAASTAASITGGTLKSNTGNELVIINNGQLTVNSVIAPGAGTSSLTLSGSGTTTLNGNNTFTGGANINSGTVVAGNANAFGTAGTVNLNGGELQSGSALTIGRAFALNRNFTLGGSNDLTLSGTFTNNSSSNTLTVTNTAATALTGGVTLSSTLTVAGSGNLTTSGVISSTGGLSYSGTGTMTLANTASTYTGVTKVSSGTLSVSTLAAGGAASGIGQATNAATSLVLDGGTFKYTGATVSTDRLFSVGGSGGTLDASGTGTVTFSNAGALGFNNTPGTRTLTLGGTNIAANTLNPIIGDHLGLYATSLTKSGAGQWVLGGVNTYTGVTTINAGTLALGASGAINANSAITVAAGATFDTTAQSYTFSTAKTTTIGVGATNAGLINAAALTFSNANLAFDFGSTSTLQSAYTVFVKTGTTGDFNGVSATGASISGSFLNAGSGNWTLTSGGYDLTFSQTLGTLTAVVSAVPEPATYAAVFGVLALAGAAVRRRRVTR